METDSQPGAVFKGPLTAEEALLAVAENLRDRGMAEFKRLRKDGVLGKAVVKAITKAIKYGYLENCGLECKVLRKGSHPNRPDPVKLCPAGYDYK